MPFIHAMYLEGLARQRPSMTHAMLLCCSPSLTWKTPSSSSDSNATNRAPEAVAGQSFRVVLYGRHRQRWRLRFGTIWWIRLRGAAGMSWPRSVARNAEPRVGLPRCCSNCRSREPEITSESSVHQASRTNSLWTTDHSPRCLGALTESVKTSQRPIIPYFAASSMPRPITCTRITLARLRVAQNNQSVSGFPNLGVQCFLLHALIFQISPSIPIPIPLFSVSRITVDPFVPHSHKQTKAQLSQPQPRPLPRSPVRIPAGIKVAGPLHWTPQCRVPPNDPGPPRSLT